MELLDTYVVSGSGIEGFLKNTEDYIASTKMARIHKANLTVLSFKELKKEKYFFTEISEDALNSFNNGIYKEFPLKVFTPKNQAERELFEETRKGPGFLLNYEGYIFFIAKSVITQLAGAAGISGAHVLKKSLIRDIYIAEGLYKNLGDDAICTLIYKRVQIEGTLIRKLFAVMGKKYVFSSLIGIRELTKYLYKRKPYGEPEAVAWKFTQNGCMLRLEFPKKVDELSKELPDRIVPGLVMMDSDSGKSSFIIMPTYRFEKSGVYVALEGKHYEHSSTFSKENAEEYVKRIWWEKQKEIVEALKEKNEKEIIGVSLKNIYMSWERSLHIATAVGKKKSSALKEMFLNEIPNSRESITEYDVAKWFINSAEKIELLDYAKRKLQLTCGKAPFVELSDIHIKWEG